MENAWSDFVDGYTGQGSFGKGAALEGDPSARWPGARAARAMRELTEIMAAENRARGPVGRPADPLDQSLRASYYHGLSDKAREKVFRESLSPELLNKVYGSEISPLEHVKVLESLPRPLDLATERGFPISLHDSASISNKLGEPAGVSLSALPSKSGPGFAADRSTVHRVMPLYGKNPREATVDLLTEEGRTFLQDSYDTVANRGLEELFRQRPELVKTLMESGLSGGMVPQRLLEAVTAGIGGTGPFNKALSEQMQAGGKRFLRYNPSRWMEHELLALDPKYALPVDYRAYGDYPYINDLVVKGTGPATPGYYKALEQLRPFIESSPERLGDIYAQRPWGERLRPEVKAHILDQLKAPEQRSLMEKFFEGRLEAPNTKVPEVSVPMTESELNKVMMESLKDNPEFVDIQATIDAYVKSMKEGVKLGFYTPEEVIKYKGYAESDPLGHIPPEKWVPKQGFAPQSKWEGDIPW